MRQSHNKNGKGTLFNFGSSFSHDGAPKVSRRCADGEPTVRPSCPKKQRKGKATSRVP